MSGVRLSLLAVLVLAVLIVLGSFIYVKATSGKVSSVTPEDKAALIYDKAIELDQKGLRDRAVGMYVVVIKNYPDSPAAERSLRRTASIYEEREQYGRAVYYYSRLLDSFPGIKDLTAIREHIEALNLKLMESPAMTENSIEYEVQPGDSLYAIAGKFGTTVGLIKKVNGLDTDLIRSGQKLKIIVSKFSILVDKSRNVLILKKDGVPFKTYTVSTGKEFCTPVGVFVIEEKMVKPPWYKVDAVVAPDSEDYELGARWMGISAPGYGIHGTADESTIGGYVTQGCVRMRNDDVVELYDIVPSGTEVEIVNAAGEAGIRPSAEVPPSENTVTAASGTEKQGR